MLQKENLVNRFSVSSPSDTNSSIMDANESNSNDDKSSRLKVSLLRRFLPQFLAVSVKNMLMFGYGMTLGFPTIVIPSIQAVNGQAPDGGILALTAEEITWFGSLNLLCVPLGCIFSGAFTERFGKRRAMQLVSIPHILSWWLYYFSTDVYHLYAALCLAGLSGGLLEAPVLTYVAEVCEPRFRGMLAATGTTSVIGGVLLQFILGSFFAWRNVAWYSLVMPILTFVALMFVPESPHWLLIRGRVIEARKSLAWLRGWVPFEAVKIEFEDLHETLKVQQDLKRAVEPGRIAAYGKGTFARPFLLVVSMFFIGNLSGTTPIQTFAVQIFQGLKSPINEFYATILLGVAELVGALICVLAVHSVGKRPLVFVSTMGCGICFMATAGYLYHLDASPEASSWPPMILILSSILFAHVGIRLIPWMLIGEVFPLSVRSGASGFSSAVSYIFGFLVNKFYLPMKSTMTLPGTFVFYAAISLLGCVFLHLIMPETEGRTLFEIEEHFAGRKRLKSSKHSKEHKGDYRLVSV